MKTDFTAPLPAVRHYVGAVSLGLCAVIAALSLPAYAKDLGIVGKTWDITEIDIRQLVMESAMRANFSQYNAQREKSAKNYTANLPRRTRAVADKTETRWIDPSITISADIQGVEDNKSKNEFQWITLFKKGTKANPLEIYRPLTAMFFFDGNSESQLEFVKNALLEDKLGRLVLVEATGADVAKLTKTLGRPVFYLNDTMAARFNINTVPSLLYAGSGEHSGLLGLTVFAAPYKTSALKGVWELDTTKSAGPMTGTANAPITK